MPQLEEGLWIEGGYYIDFDTLGQLRIIGPNNELYMGLIDIPKHKLSIEKVTAGEKGASVTIQGTFTTKSVNLYYPAMDDMRTIRDLLSHPHGHTMSFLDLRREHPTESVPMYVRRTNARRETHLLFQRNYGAFKYRTDWAFESAVSVRAINRPYKGYKLTAKKGRHIPFIIIADTNDFSASPCECRLLPQNSLEWSIFGPIAKPLEDFWNRTEIEIKHLLSWKKTSGDRFGTIFPRDWMESILLGEGDIQKETIDHMLCECLKNVDEKGRGWHEDVVGEYKYEHELAGKDLFDRKMIDIEPLYFLCLPYVSPAFFKNAKAMAKLRKSARYIVSKAKREPVITFKRHSADYIKTHTETKYHRVGDWRDSTWAYKQIHESVAPFGVNVAHYPAALRTIKQYAKQLHIPSATVQPLIKKWSQTKKWYQYSEADGKQGFALALYDIKKNRGIDYKKMRVGHLDEAYLHAFFDGTETELAHFSRALLSKENFFTKSGPTIIARNNPYGYTTAEYHGLVTWAKQAAFAVKAISRHRKIADQESWKPSTKKLLDQALDATCNSILYAFIALHAIPELHYDKDGEAHFFTDQLSTRAGMSRVQLWSAVGFRRIVREYHDFLLEKH